MARKILLVAPPLLPRERYGRLDAAGSYLPPLGLLYLAAAVSGRHEVRIVDGCALGATVDEVLDAVRSHAPDVVGITTMTPTVHRALAICGAVKEISPRTTTVLGGPHPSALPEETARAPGVDFVVVGEGDRTFPELVEAMDRGDPPESVKGLCFSRDGAVIRTACRERIMDLDSLPDPKRDLLDHARYRPSVAHYRTTPAFAVMCGRGCPYRCTFCSCAKVFRGGVAIRTPESVVAEIRRLVADRGAREILLWDDTFGLSRDWTLRFCALMRPVGVSWSAWMRCDLADREKLSAMARSGCWHVSYGVESGSQDLLDGIRKGMTLDHARNAFAWTHEAGMEARGTFIFGLPGETRDTMRRTTDFAIELRADYAQFQFLTPYPGTELWDDAVRRGRFTTADYSEYTIWCPVFLPEGLARADLEEAIREAYRRFYLRPSYVLGRLGRLRTFADLRRNLAGFRGLTGFLSGGPGRD